MGVIALARLNNDESCIVCARRSDGLAVGNAGDVRYGRPNKFGWYCLECGPVLAWKVLYMGQPNMDKIEQRACIAVAELAVGSSEDTITIPANELPAFIAWCVKEFADAVRREVTQ